MPPKRKTKAEAAETSPEPAVEISDEAVAAAAGIPEGDAGDVEEPPEPLNRAERRAKGKGGVQTQPTSRGKVVGGKGPASSNRMWANRRSG